MKRPKQATPAQPQHWLKVGEVAARLGFARRTIVKMVERGQLGETRRRNPAYPNSAILIQEAAVAAFEEAASGGNPDVD